MILNLKHSPTNGLLYIRITSPAAPEPLIDDVTKKVTWLLRNYSRVGKLMREGIFVPGLELLSGRSCDCGLVAGTWFDFELVEVKNSGSKRMMMSALGVHIAARHRSDIPQEMLDLIRSLDCDMAIPTQDELAGIISIRE